MSFISWTDDKVRSVAHMVASCIPSVEIAKIMTDKHDEFFTKNSIISICRRSGISWPGGRKLPRKKKKPRGSTRMTALANKYRYPEQEPDLLALFQAYHGEERYLEELTHLDCKFPLERSHSHVFCGLPIAKGSYCQYHYDACYTTGEAP